MEKAKRYLVFLFGLFISSFGVSLITKANLGTSPISAIPYVLSLNFPFTLGQFTIAFSLFLILLQLFILRRNFKAEHLLQIPISVAFGYFIDLTMVMLGFVAPGSYPVKLVALLIGCVILGFGVYLEVIADVAMLPGESFVRAVTQTWKTDFGTTKVCFDVSMTAIAAITSLVLAHTLYGVREGTVIAALLVGFIARLFGRLLPFVPDLLFGKKTESEAAEAVENGKGGWVIAIGRQYGSGGRVIGQKLAQTEAGLRVLRRCHRADGCRYHRLHAPVCTPAGREYDQQLFVRSGEPDVRLRPGGGIPQGQCFPGGEEGH